MKKLKVLLSSLLACVLAFSLAGCSANCGGDDGTGGGEDVIVPTGITINTDSVKTQYNVDEDYSSEGLIVTLSEHNQTQNVDVDPRVLELTDENLTIDSSDFIKGTPGTYAINVSYTAQEVTVETSYEVTVKLGAGLVIEKGITTYALDSDGTTIDLSDLTVYLAGAFGQRGEPISNYTSELYLGDQKVEATNNQYVVTASGAYHVWVELNDYTVPGISEVEDHSAFVIVYDTDDLQSNAYNSEATGTLTTQETGADVMTPTWTFTATYASGLTKPLTSEEVEIEGVVTNAATEAGEATVTYTELNAKGEEDVVSTTVNYVVEERQAAVSGVAGIGFDNMIVGAYNVEYDATIHGALSISDSNNIVTSATVNGARPGKTDNWNINSLEEPVTITTDNGDVTVNKAFQLRGGSYTTRRNVQIELPTDATYTINVWASNSNAGRYVVAYNGTDSSWHFDYDENGTAVTSPNAPAYAVGESVTSSISKRTLNNAAGGTYYIGGNGDITIYYIEIIAEANEPQGQIYSIDFTDTTKIATNENFVGADATELVAITDVSGNATGFYVTKCGSSGKYTAITTKNSIQCLQFQGAGTTEKNSIAITVGPGEVEVVMSYYQNKDGRYLKVLNEGLDTVPATSDELTSTDYSIKTRTVKFTLTEATTIYIGSAESGLYVSSISIIVK